MLCSANELPSFNVTNKVNLPWLFKIFYCIDKANNTVIYFKLHQRFRQSLRFIDVFFIYICKQKKRSNNKTSLIFFVQNVLISTFVLVAVINQEMYVMYDLPSSRYV